MNDFNHPPTESPFHPGEQVIQTRLGVREIIEPWARKVVLPYLPGPHQDFYAQLPFLVLAARDGQDRPWVTLVTGEQGFAKSPQPGTLSVNAAPTAGDPLNEALAEGDDIGLLGIELHSRRRNRVNGQVAARSPGRFELAVGQAFGNCPQYIHERQWHLVSPTSPPPPPQHHQRLPASLRAFIERADTFFIASGHRGDGENPAFGMDASHRGGMPGFVRVVDPGTLLIPDYAGNNHFNTLGNLELDSRAGLLFVDFERGDMLQLTGHARVEWQTPDLDEFPGARRLLRFELNEAVERQGVLPLRFDAPGAAVRELRLVDKITESDDITSFVFASRDGAPLAGFNAGQYLPIELDIPGHQAPVSRTYSLSGSPNDPEHYRITVKREPHGLVSRYLHDQVEVGHILSAYPPRGDFVIEHEGAGPIVLVSAGVGLTPLTSMLHALANDSAGRPVWFVHGARDGNHHPLEKEVRRLANDLPDVNLHVAYSHPLASDTEGENYDTHGRIDASLLHRLIQDRDADFYLCGPMSFMASLQQQLEDLGVAPDRIRTEIFGPVA